MKLFPKKTKFQYYRIDLSYYAIERLEAKPFKFYHGGGSVKKIPIMNLGKALRRGSLFRRLLDDNQPVLVQMYGRQIEIMIESYRRKKMGW